MNMSRLAILFSALALAGPARAETLKVLANESDSFFYQKDGNLTGIEYDILDYFAKSRNATLQIVWVDTFAALMERIEKGEADLAAGTITITPERARRMDFTGSYFPVQVILVERMSDDTKSLMDLAGQKVGAFAKTTAEDALKAVPGILIVHEGTIQDQMGAIERGEMEGRRGARLERHHPRARELSLAQDRDSPRRRERLRLRAPQELSSHRP